MTQTQKEQEQPGPRHSKGILSHPGRDFDVDEFLRSHPRTREVAVDPSVDQNQPMENEPLVPIRDSEGKAVLGQKFLDATNHWLRNPDAPIEKKLSVVGKSYIREITWVFERAKKQLIDSKGRTIEDNPIISDMPLPEYIEFIKEKIQYPEEFAYIHGLITHLQEDLRTTQQELLKESAPQSSTPGILERLEALQKSGRGNQFKSTRQE